MSLRKQATSNVFWVGIEKGGSTLCALITFSILSRLLSADDFGIVAMAFIFISFANIFLEIGFAEAIIQREDISDEHLSTVFWMSVGIGTVLTLVAIAASPLVAMFFGEPRLTAVSAVLALSFLWTALSSAHRAILHRKMMMRSLGIRSLAGKIMGGIVGVSLAFLGFGVWALVFQQLAAGVVGVILLWRLCEWRPTFSFSREKFLDLWGFSINILGHKVLMFFATKLDKLVIGYFLGSVLLGYYSVGYRIFELLGTTLTGVLCPAVLPMFARLQNDRSNLQTATLKGLEILSAVTFPLFLGGFFLGEELILSLFGAKWEPSVPVFRVLMLAGLVESVLSLNGTVMIALGKPGTLFRIWIVGIAVLLAAYLGTVSMGIAWIAMAYLLNTILVIGPLNALVTLKATGLPFKEYSGVMVRPALASIVMLAVLAIVMSTILDGSPNPVRLAAGVPLGAVAYSLALFGIWPGCLDEIRMFRASLKPTQP